MRFFWILILFTFTCLNFVAQEEVLSPLETNLSGEKLDGIKRIKSIDSLIIYSVDTLQLPVFDDFSTNRFQKYESSYSGSIQNTLFYSLKDKFTGKPFYDYKKYTFNKSYTTIFNTSTI